ncbi:MAG: histidinol-phosphate transaminase [Planctomycetota bacterium]
MFRPALSQLTPYVPGEQSAPGKTVKLNTNENPYPPPEAVIQAIRDAAQGPINRYPDPIASNFRRLAAEALGLPGPDWILAGNGSDEILTLLVRGYVGEGEQIRLPYPSYILYRTLAEIQGAGWQQVPFQEDFTLPRAFGLDDDGLKLALVPNPNSPTGTVVSNDSLNQIATQLPCPLVVDEAYVEFASDNALTLVQENPNLLVTRTFSKSYALAGIRFGFLVAQPSIVSELLKIKDSYNCDALSIAAATAAVQQQDWLRDVVARMNATRSRMTAALESMGFDVTPSQANFVWCTHPGASHEAIYEYLRRHQVLIRYMQFPGWGDGIRISVGTDDEVDACLMLIERYLDSLAG